MPGPASRLLAQNMVNLVTLMTVDSEFRPDFDDEIVAGACVTTGGQVRHAPTAELLSGGTS
jgi:NAD(P) transhydrogenase subunit alpha